jgi:hypothetical protein
MEAVAADTPPLSESGARRMRQALGHIAGRKRPDVEGARLELEDILIKIVS